MQSSGLTPTPTPNRARLQASGVDTCQAADLTSAIGFQGATQALAGDLTLTSHETAPCVLTGSAEVQLIDARGQMLAVKDIAPPDAGQPTPVVVQPGQSAYVRLFWRNWCGSQPALPLQAQVSWPGSGRRVTTTLFKGAPSDRHPLDLTPVCNAPGTDSALSVYPFRATP